MPGSWSMVGITVGFTGFVLLVFAGADASFPEMIDGAEMGVVLDGTPQDNPSASPTTLQTPPPTSKVPPTRLSTLHPAVPPFDDHNYNYNTTGLPPPPAKKIVYFQHIHKSAGTTICKIARKAYKARPKQNCNVDVGEQQPCCGRTPLENRKWAIERPGGYNFVANEQFMYDYMDTEAFDYLFSTRDPRARMVSDYLFQKRYHPEITTLDYFLYKWDRRRGDNYMLRCICGQKCFFLPCGELTMEHLQYAMDRLDRFAYVFTVEEFEYTTRGTHFHKKERANVYPGSSDKKHDLIKQLHKPKYEKLFFLDDVLHSHARQLAMQRIARLKMDEYQKESRIKNYDCVL